MTGPNSIRVIKVGGSVLRSSADIETVVDRLSDTHGDAIVVTSALNGTTDSLVSLLEDDELTTDTIDAFIEELRSTHLSCCVGGEDTRGRLSTAIDPVLEQLSDRLHSIDGDDEIEDVTRDAVLATGERLSARVLATSISAVDGDAIAIDADELGVVTDGTFGRATARLDATKQRIREPLLEHLEAGRLPVVTGYFGRGETGDVTTFGRGGTDYSAAIVANCVGATQLDIWKDVEGFLTADPTRIPTARVVPYMTYDEAAELAYLGVQVLHPRTLEPLKAADIPVNLGHVAADDASGTQIGPGRDEPDRLRAIGAKEGFGIVRMHGSAMAYEPGVGAKVFSLLSDHDINIVNMAASQATFALLVDDSDTEQAADILESAAIPTVESVTFERGFALLCIVGKNIGLREGVAGRVFTVVGKAGVNIEMISVGSSNVAMSFVVDRDNLEAAMAALHEGLDTFSPPDAMARSEAPKPFDD